MVRTLQELLDEGERIFAHHARRYPVCSHYSQLDVQWLIARLGPDFDLVTHRTWFCRRLRCTACGTKGTDTDVSLSPPDKNANVKNFGTIHGGDTMRTAPGEVTILRKRRRKKSQAAPRPDEF